MRNNHSHRYSIVLLFFWFGPFPWYFRYFIHSCRFNPSIRFILTTDNQEVLPDLPENVGITYKTLEEVKDEITQKIGFPVNIEYPYKLCDFRPAFGYLFPELIKGYDFWGHGDIDVVYGNIRAFITEEILSHHNVVNSRHDYIAGHSCLFRNTKEINSLFKQSKDYKLVFTSRNIAVLMSAAFYILTFRMANPFSTILIVFKASLMSCKKQ